MNKNVCFVMPKTYGLFNPKSDVAYGGAEVQMFVLANELAKDKNYTVDFIVADYRQDDTEMNSNIQLIKAFSFKDNPAQKIVRFIKAMNKTDAGTFIFMTLTPISFFIACHLKFKGKKYIHLVSHDGETDGGRASTYRPTWLNHFAYNLCNHLIVQNEYQFKSLEKRNKNIHLLKSSLPLPIGNEIKGKYHLWIARAEKWKYPEGILQLAELEPNEKFLIICPPISETDLNWYDALVNTAQNLDNVKWQKSYSPFEKMDELFSNCKTFINTSQSEGFATTFVHATQHNKPILTLNSNPDNVLNKNKIGLCADGDFEIFKKQFEDLKNESVYRQYSVNSKKYFDTFHNPKNNIEKLKLWIQH